MIAAVVPAAGASRRMGRPKLTLTVGGRSVIARVVSALIDGGASPVVVVVPPPEAPGAIELGREAALAGAEVVTPATQPADMRASFLFGLGFWDGRRDCPETVLLVPADSPGLCASLVSRVIRESREVRRAIVVPTVGGRRGHPIALPWALALGARDLPDGVGINALVANWEERVRELPTDDPAAVDDLDTPEDYRRWVETE